MGQVHAAALHADEDHAGAGFIPLGDFVRDPGEGPVERRSVEDDDVVLVGHKKRTGSRREPIQACARPHPGRANLVR
jgi:hypothetical protein